MKWLCVSALMAIVATLIIMTVFSAVCDVKSPTHSWHDYFSFGMKAFGWFAGIVWVIVFFIGRLAGISKRLS